MPNKDEHLQKARHDEEFADSLDVDNTHFLDWAVPSLFYAGLHYIEAYFAISGVHSPDHRTRDSSVRRDPNLRPLYADFNELKNYSINARYYMVPFAPSDVQKLKDCLASIKDRVTPLL